MDRYKKPNNKHGVHPFEALKVAGRRRAAAPEALVEPVAASEAGVATAAVELVAEAEVAAEATCPI